MVLQWSITRMKKTPPIFFSTGAEKTNPIGKPDFCRRKTNDVGRFFVQKRKLPYTEIFASLKSLKLLATSTLKQTKETFGSIISNLSIIVTIIVSNHLHKLFYSKRITFRRRAGVSRSVPSLHDANVFKLFADDGVLFFQWSAFVFVSAPGPSSKEVASISGEGSDQSSGLC